VNVNIDVSTGGILKTRQSPERIFRTYSVQFFSSSSSSTNTRLVMAIGGFFSLRTATLPTSHLVFFETFLGQLYQHPFGDQGALVRQKL